VCDATLYEGPRGAGRRDRTELDAAVSMMSERGPSKCTRVWVSCSFEMRDVGSRRLQRVSSHLVPAVRAAAAAHAGPAVEGAEQQLLAQLAALDAASAGSGNGSGAAAASQTGAPRVRSDCRFGSRGTDYFSEYDMKWISGGTKRQCDRALGAPLFGALHRSLLLLDGPVRVGLGHIVTLY
jgi:hypothetical protein